MTVIATVQNGAIPLPPGTELPDGTEVRILFADPEEAPLDESATQEEGALAWMLKYAGTVDGLPEDFADEHDHYIHGTPRRSPKK